MTRVFLEKSAEVDLTHIAQLGIIRNGAVLPKIIDNFRQGRLQLFVFCGYLGTVFIDLKQKVINAGKIIKRVVLRAVFNRFEEGVNQLIGMRDEWPEMGNRMKTLYRERYCWDEMERRLIQLYTDLQNEEDTDR